MPGARVRASKLCSDAIRDPRGVRVSLRALPYKEIGLVRRTGVHFFCGIAWLVVGHTQQAQPPRQPAFLCTLGCQRHRPDPMCRACSQTQTAARLFNRHHQRAGSNEHPWFGRKSSWRRPTNQNRGPAIWAQPGPASPLGGAQLSLGSARGVYCAALKGPKRGSLLQYLLLVLMHDTP